jgi:hypothetical protein
MSLPSPSHVGDPGGVKARTAGQRGVSTRALPFVRRLANYQNQPNTGLYAPLTPAQLRRSAKKLRAAGDPVTAAAIRPGSFRGRPGDLA